MKRFLMVAAAAGVLFACSGAPDEGREFTGPPECGDIGATAPTWEFSEESGFLDPDGNTAEVRLNCSRPIKSGGSTGVAQLEFLPCTDGSVLYMIDRRDVDGLEEEKKVQVWALSGQPWQDGRPTDEDRAACKGD